MTDQKITAEEITAKCLEPLGVALIENLALEKRVEQLKTNEARLIERIKDLETKLVETKEGYA
jgi:hypothetical protein